VTHRGPCQPRTCWDSGVLGFCFQPEQPQRQINRAWQEPSGSLGSRASCISPHPAAPVLTLPPSRAHPAARCRPSPGDHTLHTMCTHVKVNINSRRHHHVPAVFFRDFPALLPRPGTRGVRTPLAARQKMLFTQSPPLSQGRSEHPWGGGKGGRQGQHGEGSTGGLLLHRNPLGSRGSLQTPKSLLVMEPRMVLCASQVKPLSQGHL